MSSDVKKVHYNVPQLMYALIQTQIAVCVWGRATGKSEGPMSTFSIKNIFTMPKSNGFLLGTTYEQLLTRTLPPLIAGWEKLGYHQDIHFSIRKFLPDKQIPKAYRAPQKADNYIHWFNGSGIYLVSQDRPGTINGVRTQWGAGDEARLLNYSRVQEEVLPTMAGHADLFGHLSNYLSQLYCSDMPRTAKGRWLLDFQKQMDPDEIQAILMVQVHLIKLREELVSATPSKITALARDIRKYEEQLNVLRKGTVYFSLASTLDNIHVLGMDVIKNFIRVLSELEFQISVLNKMMLKVEKGFYSLLNEDIHGYDMVNYGYVDNVDINYKQPQSKNCLWDADINPNLPLEIALDYNNSINSIVTGQDLELENRLLSSMYVEHPLLLNDVIEKWHDYYSPRINRDVTYYYDHTGKDGKRANSNQSFSEEVIAQLIKLGWNVNPVYLGQTPSHHYRYELWGKVFQEREESLPRFRYNRTNAASWSVSAQQCGVRTVGEEVKKDKRPEQQDNFPQAEAPHISDAGDTLLWAWLRNKVGKVIPYIPEMIG